jgi:hypothetical protein
LNILGKRENFYRLFIKRRDKENGAGDGNRTHMASLEGWSFTTKLHPLLAISARQILTDRASLSTSEFTISQLCLAISLNKSKDIL